MEVLRVEWFVFEVALVERLADDKLGTQSFGAFKGWAQCTGNRHVASRFIGKKIWIGEVALGRDIKDWRGEIPAIHG